MDFYFRKRDQAAVALVLLAIILLVWVRTALVNQGEPTVNLDHAGQLDYRFSIDINQSEWHELALVPGIGRALAKRIVDHRKRVGNFQSSDQLLEVDGIGPRKLESLKRFLLEPDPPLGQPVGNHPAGKRLLSDVASSDDQAGREAVSHE